MDWAVGAFDSLLLGMLAAVVLYSGVAEVVNSNVLLTIYS
jgi:hypothetical protein